MIPKIFSFLILLIIFQFKYLNCDSQFKKILPKYKNIEKNKKRITLSGSIEIPEDTESFYIYICYNGKLLKLNNENLFFTIKDFDTDVINMLFVSPDNIIVNSQDNTIISLKLIEKNKYRFYKFKKEIENPFNKNNDGNLTWKEYNQEKLKSKNNSLTIPLNTLIVFFDPNEINFSIDKVSWKKNSNSIEIPKIVINKIKDKKVFDKYCLAFMDIRQIHGEQEKKEILQNNTKRCMII